MDQVTKVRKQLNGEQWRRLIIECRSSGMSVRAWCRTKGIVEQTYYRNLKKIRKELCKSLPAAMDKTETV